MKQKKIREQLICTFEEIKHLEGITIQELATRTNHCEKTIRRYLNNGIIESESHSNIHIIFVKSLLGDFTNPLNELNLPKELSTLGLFPPVKSFVYNGFWTASRNLNRKKLTLVKTKNREFVCVLSSLDYIKFVLSAQHSHKRKKHEVYI